MVFVRIFEPLMKHFLVFLGANGSVCGGERKNLNNLLKICGEISDVFYDGVRGKSSVRSAVRSDVRSGVRRDKNDGNGDVFSTDGSLIKKQNNISIDIDTREKVQQSQVALSETIVEVVRCCRVGR